VNHAHLVIAQLRPQGLFIIAFKHARNICNPWIIIGKMGTRWCLQGAFKCWGVFGKALIRSSYFFAKIFEGLGTRMFENGNILFFFLSQILISFEIHRIHKNWNMTDNKSVFKNLQKERKLERCNNLTNLTNVAPPLLINVFSPSRRVLEDYLWSLS